MIHPASFTALFEPSATASLETFCATRDYLVLETLDTVKSRYIFWRFDEPTASASTGTSTSTSEPGAAGVWTMCGAEPSKCTARISKLLCCLSACISC